MSTSVEAQLSEQQKIIAYLTSRYEKDTGRKLALPTQIGELLGDPSILGSVDQALKEEVKEEMTFMKALEALDLPKPLSNEKGKQ